MRLQQEAKLFFAGLAALIIAVVWWVIWDSGRDQTGVGCCTIGILIIVVTAAVVTMDSGSGPK